MMKKAILSFIRRLCGAEKNYQKLAQIEEKILCIENLVGAQRLERIEEKILCIENLVGAQRLKQIEEKILHIEQLVGSQQEVQKMRDEYLAPIRELCIQGIYNSISLATLSTSRSKRLFVPGGSQKYYDFSVVEGNLSLGKENSNARSTPPIFIISNMKSGTYFLGKILSNLGVSDVNVHADNSVFTDHNSRTVEQQLNCDVNYLVGLPFYIQFQCMAPGQFLLGHIDFQYAELLRNQRKFCCIRELRHTFVSMLRFCQRRNYLADKSWFHKGETEEALWDILNDASMASHFIYLANNIAKWCDAYPESIIKYEYLIDENSPHHELVLARIAKITDNTVEEVRVARKEAYGKETHSFSGRPSTLNGIWSERVEEKFQEVGGHLINATLGYPGSWQEFC